MSFKTRIVPANDNNIADAAKHLLAGELVAFPTETVYGLGANALDDAAVQKIYDAKGRPANNPTIVHVADAQMARGLVTEWPEAADRLAASFWPGPLTIILPRSATVPAVVAAGGDTVGIRVPAHPVALALIRAAGVPIAAPSANRSGEISPTSARHVAQSLDGRIPLILDGGSTGVGIESTVLDLSGTEPRVLRPGAVTAQQIEAVLGLSVAANDASHFAGTQPLLSPGLLERHYAPRAELRLVEPSGSPELAKQLLAEGKRIGRMTISAEAAPSHLNPADTSSLLIIPMPADAVGYARRLYSALHQMDSAAVEIIIADLPPRLPEWAAIHDRLKRASAR